MSKELEALERGIIEFEKDLEDDCNNEWLKRVVAGMKKCYQRLEAIDNANPSEALEGLKSLDIQVRFIGILDVPSWEKYLPTIKQALLELKAIKESNPSEALKELDYIGKNCYEEAGNAEEDCILYAKNYIGFDTIKNYILKAQENENRINIEIESKKKIIKHNFALHKENAELKRVLEIIWKKRVDMWHLADLLDQTYEMYLAFCESEKYEKDYILSEEEFDLLKRW